MPHNEHGAGQLVVPLLPPETGLPMLAAKPSFYVCAGDASLGHVPTSQEHYQVNSLYYTVVVTTA